MNFPFYNTPWVSQPNKPLEYVPFKKIFRFQKVKSPTKVPVVLSLTQQGIVVRDISTNEGQIAADYSDSAYVSKGDFVLNPMDLRSGSVAISKFDGVTSNAYYIFRVRDELSSQIHPKFYEYYLWSNYKNDAFYSHGSGVGRPEGSGGRWTLGRETLEGFPVPLPTLEEQRRIANFLDEKIETLLKIQTLRQDQLGLLRDQQSENLRLRIMELNPKTQPLKYFVTKIGSGKTPRGGGDVYKDAGVLFLRSQNIYNDGLRLDDAVFISPEVDAAMSSSQVKAGDLLLNITGGSIGRCARVPDEFEGANVNQHVCIIRPRDPRLTSLLHAQLLAPDIQDAIREVQVDGNREGLNFVQVGNLPIRIPADLRSIQQLGSGFANSNGATNSLVATLEDQLQLILQYKTSLINSAVIGTFDVTTGRSVA